MAYTIDSVIQRAGFFTQQIYLQGRTLQEIESLLGYNSGRLSKGASFAIGIELPDANGFNLAGYSQVAAHHTHQQYGKNINTPQTKGDKDAYAIKKRNAMSGWGLNGSQRLIKVIPSISHIAEMKPDKQYPPGQGIPQWELVTPISWRIISVVNEYPIGKFIPTEGFKMVKLI